MTSALLSAASYPDLSGKKVYVTGGASGIGAAIVEAFHAQYAHVYFSDISVPTGQALADQLGERCHFLRADASDPAEIRKSIEQAVSEMQGLDILVNNVGNDLRQAIDEVSPDDWRASLAVNLDPVFFASQAAAPHIAASGGGAIVNLSSLNAYLGPASLAAYSAAKAAILGLTKSLADAYGKSRIRVNAIAPGWVVTEKQKRVWLTPEVEKAWKSDCCLKDDLLPEDIANLVLFLSSDAARMITSQSVIIDAGRL